MATIIPLPNTPDSIHQEYASEQEVLIPSILSSSLFNPSTDYMVFSLETVDGEFLYSTRNTRYAVRNVPNTITKETTSEVVTFPLEDIQNSGYSEGNYNVFYNFYRTALESDIYSFFIKEISPNRTEVRLSVNNVEDDKIQLLFNEFKALLDEGTYFKDFYLNIGDYYYIAVNTQLDTSASPNTILFKTYQPLPSDISLNTQVQVVFETAETYGFNVDIPIVPIEFEDDIEYVRGPNFNLGIIDEVNNTTFEQDYTSLVNTPLTSSYNQIQNLLNQKGVTIDTDYTDFSNFIHFSSAEQRLLNFYYKVSLIESYNNDINLIQTITGSTSSSIAVTASIQNIQNQITDLIKNFDGYENFLYYTSGAYAYPKSNLTQPYTLYSTGSNEVLTWLGSTNESSGFYGGILLSASLYDNENQDYLYNSVPKYIKEDPINAGYELFISMVGQHFDNLYIYINAITDRYDADNRVNYGIPKELVADALKSMGIKLYQNNFSSDDLYAAFLGINGSGSFLPPTGSEVITNYVTASNEPIPLNNLNLETYKRLYHNLPYLLKKKGTIEGLRTLINIFGIPDTILRISEFGGKDKDNTNDWDYFHNKFNYALYNSSSSPTSRVTGEWSGINSAWGSEGNVPETLFLRFKPSSLPLLENYSLLFTIWDNTISTRRGYITLSYTGSSFTSGSYSGSIPSSSKDYATLKYWNETTELLSVDAPFYNNNWWSLSINRSANSLKLSTAEKIYDGNDGFKIGYTASDNYSGTLTSGWATGTVFHLPSSGSGGVSLGGETYYGLTGSFQELRFYSDILFEEAFYDYVMNPYSIEGINYLSSADNLIFRAPLGSDLITTVGTRTSIHPKITGSYITHSFSSTSNYTIGSNLTFVPNTEFIYYDQPAVGIRNRISEKIRIEDNIIPSGDTLTPYRSLQQRYPQSESYTRDVNYVEVAFSPQNEINDDINSSMGYFNIGEYIGDPRQISESTYSYPDLDKLRDSYFSKYFKNYNWNDYIRLIKYFDNSLFKMIKDFTPARSGLATGVVIKQHLLERNRQRPAQVEISQHDYSGSIESGFVSGGSGGVYDDLSLVSPQVTQSWTYEVETKYGPQIVTQSTQDEFYNGELKGTEYEITNGELGIILDTSLEGSIIAYYGQVYKYLNFDNKPGNINRMTYVVDKDGRDGNIIGFLFVNEASDIDENSVDLAPYLSLLKFGDILQLRTSGDNQIFKFVVISSTPYTYLSYPGHQVNVLPYPVIGDWDNLGTGFKSFSVEWIYDSSISNIQNSIKGNEPLQNNIVDSRLSLIYQDVDYSTGLLSPTNFNLLVSGTADKAPIQDSNYTTTGWTNSRYKGSRASSPDFNI